MLTFLTNRPWPGRIFLHCGTGLFLVLLLTTASCRHGAEPPGAEPPGAAPVVNEAELTAEIRDRWAGVISLKADAGISLIGEDFFYPGIMTVDAVKPDRARVDILNPLGGSVVALLFHGETYRQWIPGEEAVYETLPAETALVERLKELPGPPPAAWLAALLTGHLAARLENVHLKWQKGDEKAFVRPREGIEPAVILSDFAGKAVMSRLILAGDARRRTVIIDYDDYAMVEGRPLPMAVRVDIPYFGYRMSLTYRRVRINARVDESIFGSSR